MKKKVVVAAIVVVLMYACVMAASRENDGSSESSPTSTPRRQSTVSSRQTPSPELTPSPTSALPIQSCDELSPRIIDLSEENENPFAGRILKLYEIAEVSRTDTRLDCQASARWNRGGDSSINFHVEVDADGDGFIGYERGDVIEPTATPGPPLTPTPTLEEGVYPPGMYRVGIDIQPGLYEGQARCYWERLKGLSGDSEDTIAVDYLQEGDGRFFVEILPSDSYFRLQYCSVQLVPENE